MTFGTWFAFIFFSKVFFYFGETSTGLKNVHSEWRNLHVIRVTASPAGWLCFLKKNSGCIIISSKQEYKIKPLFLDFIRFFYNI